MKHDKRDDIDEMTNFEIISIHDNDFFDVAIDMTNEIIVVANDVVDNSINVEKIDDIDVENVEKNETNEVNEIIMMIVKNEKNFFDFLQCLMRTCL